MNKTLSLEKIHFFKKKPTDKWPKKLSLIDLIDRKISMLEEIRKRILNFIDLLEESPVQIVYFKQDPRQANVKHILKKFDIDNQTFYINSGPQGLWIRNGTMPLLLYIYRPNELKELFTMSETSILTQLTIEIQSRNKELQLISRFTDYEDGSIYPSTKYQVPLKEPITNEVPCSTKSFPLWLNVLQRVQQVSRGELNLGDLKSVSGGFPFLTEALVEMLYTYVVEPVQTAYSKENMFSIQSTLFYDKENPNMVLMYLNEEHHTCKIFYLEVDKVASAYQATLSEKPSIGASRCLDELHSIAETHRIEVQTM